MGVQYILLGSRTLPKKAFIPMGQKVNNKFSTDYIVNSCRDREVLMTYFQKLIEKYLNNQMRLKFYEKHKSKQMNTDILFLIK